jgi:hypothetical protein
MNKYLDEFIEYTHKLIISGAEFKSPEEIASIAELTKQKYIEILKRDGYSEQLSNVIFDKSHLWNIIYGYRRKNPDSFLILNLLKIHVKREIESIATNLFILRLSLLYDPTRSIEEKIRVYLVKERHSPEEIERLLPFFIEKFINFPDDSDKRLISQSSIQDDFRSIFEKKITYLKSFIENNKIGNLSNIYTISNRLIRIIDKTINPIINTVELEQTVREYLNQIEVPEDEIEITLPSILEKIYNFKEFNDIREVVLTNPILLPDIINTISFKINYEIYNFRINKFLDTIEFTEENVQAFINKYKILRSTFNNIMDSIFDKKIGLFIKENNNFTVSSVNEFLLANKGLSREAFETILNSYKQFLDPGITIYPDPNIKPETGESLSSTGRVLPNCALCWNILNINIAKDSKYRIAKLPCGGLFHANCILIFHKKYGKICPTCGKDS